MLITVIILMVICIAIFISHWVTVKEVREHNIKYKYDKMRIRTPYVVRFWISLIVFAICAGIVYESLFQ